MKKITFSSLLAICVVFSGAVCAEPRTVTTTIENLRSFDSGGLYVTVATNQLAGGNGTCTKVYLIDPTAELVASQAMLAFTANKDIVIEIPNEGCTGFGTKVRSLFVYP